MTDIFNTAKQKLVADFNTPMVRERMASVRLAIVPPHEMARNLHGDNYRRALNIPAYYDPTTHTVFLNEQIRRTTSSDTLFIIAYHELIHGASAHVNYTDASGQTFQSGVKIEQFSKDEAYTCYNRMVNEGIVQYFALKNNGYTDFRSYAYASEVKCMQHVAEALGERVLRESLLEGNCDMLAYEFNAHFGEGTFETFARALDARDYARAESLVSPSEDITYASFLSFNEDVPVAA